ncbi:hypothetical protein KY361_04475 [Candidatus Woesearchaeota archaeon]|nr:hypothetical protein [Candidatus Woesearchaeota archaeon]
MNKILLEAIGVSIIGTGVLAYIRVLKKRIRKYILRHEKIEKYFKENN